MAKTDRPAGGLVRWLRWAGRILGTCSGAFWLFMGIVSTVAGQDPWTGESTMLAILIAAAAAGAGIAWWREDIGGIVLLASGIGHGIFGYLAAGHRRYVPVLIAGLPFSLAGLLTIAAWRLREAASD